MNPTGATASSPLSKRLWLTYLLLILCVPSFVKVDANTQVKTASLYSSLNPYSVSEQLAFYELYPNTPEGKKALQRSLQLLGNSSIISLPRENHSFIALVNRSTFTPISPLSDADLAVVENLGKSLPHKSLKGHSALTEEDTLLLDPSDIDLSRALLISQEQDLSSIRQYEASLDLMALQILAKLQNEGGLKAPPERKIEEMNNMIFNELHFRFPPHSEYAPDIDQYTFLSSVIDSRRGVCLGVSILYLSLAQRIHLPLEIVTPPGHIFVRYCSNGKTINIETTARGANMPTEVYLGINTKTLQERTLKEAVGLAHFNQAAVFSRRKEYDKAVSCYKKAQMYMPEDLLLQELLAFHLIFLGQVKEGSALLEKSKNTPLPGAIVVDPSAQDFLYGNVDAAGLEALFLHVDDNQASILNKQNLLKASLAKYPAFRSGLLQLATTWLQLSRTKEAVEILERYHTIDDTSPEVEYELAVLYGERFDYNKAWKALQRAEKLTAEKNHFPKALRSLREQLSSLCPEPSHK